MSYHSQSHHFTHMPHHAHEHQTSDDVYTVCPKLLHRHSLPSAASKTIYAFSNSNIKCSDKNVVYSIICIKCLKMYIDQSCLPLRRRIHSHIHSAKCTEKKMWPIYRHFHRDSHDFDRDTRIIPLEKCRKKNLLLREIFWRQLYTWDSTLVLLLPYLLRLHSRLLSPFSLPTHPLSPSHTRTPPPHTHTQIETIPSPPVHTELAITRVFPGSFKTKELYPWGFPCGQVGSCPLNNTPPHGPQTLTTLTTFCFLYITVSHFNVPTLLPGGHASSGLRYNAVALMMHDPWQITSFFDLLPWIEFLIFTASVRGFTIKAKGHAVRMHIAWFLWYSTLERGQGTL